MSKTSPISTQSRIGVVSPAVAHADDDEHVLPRMILNIKSLAGYLPTIQLEHDATVADLAHAVISCEPDAYHNCRPVFIRTLADGDSVELEGKSRQLSSFGLQLGVQQDLALIVKTLPDMSEKFKDLIVAEQTESAVELLHSVDCCITKLNLKNTYYSADFLNKLQMMMTHMTSLTHLSLCKISNFHVLIPSVSSLTSLKHLGLSDNNLAANDCLALGLSNLVSLTHLDLSINRINGYSVCVLAPAFSKLTSLTYLDMSCNGMNDIGCCKLVKALSDSTSLTYLDLKSNEIGHWLHVTTYCTLFKYLSSLVSLKHLLINFVHIDHTLASALVQPLDLLISLTNLTISNTHHDQQDSKSCIALIPTVSSLVNLTHLNLSYSHFSARFFAVALPNLVRMQYLRLWKNRITDYDCHVMAPALSQLVSLTELDLSFNEFGDEGLGALALALPSMISLNKCQMQGNQISDDGCRELAPVLRSMQSMHKWSHGRLMECASCHQLLIDLRYHRYVLEVGVKE